MTDTTKRRYTADLYAHVVLEFTFKGRNEWEGRCHLGQLGFLFGHGKTLSECETDLRRNITGSLDDVVSVYSDVPSMTRQLFNNGVTTYPPDVEPRPFEVKRALIPVRLTTSQD